MAKTSASNVAERSPIKGRASAKPVAGAIGSALAAMVLQHAEEVGMREVKERESRKQTLARLWDFPSNAEHVAFRNDLTAALEQIKKQAEAAKLSLNDYSDANPVAATKRSEVSLWDKMSRAVEHGFNKTVVDLSKPWPAISKAATDHLANIAQSSGEPGKVNAGPRQRKAGRKATPALDRAKKFAKEVLVDEKTMAVKPDVNLAKIVGELLLRATVAQCDEVIAECVRIRDMKIEVEKSMAEKAQKESNAAKDMQGAPDKTSAEVADMQAKTSISKAKKGEHATAYDPKTQSKLRDGTIVDVKPNRKARATA